MLPVLSQYCGEDGLGEGGNCDRMLEVRKGGRKCERRSALTSDVVPLVCLYAGDTISSHRSFSCRVRSTYDP